MMWIAVLCAYISGNAFASIKVSIWSYPGSLVTIPCGLLFGIIMACHLSKPGKELELDGWLGDISYPLFLAHGPVMMGVASALKATGTTFSFITMFAILMGSSILVAQAVLVFVERPVMRMRRRVSAASVQPNNAEVPAATA